MHLRSLFLPFLPRYNHLPTASSIHPFEKFLDQSKENLYLNVYYVRFNMEADGLTNMPLPNDMSLSFLLNGWLQAAIRRENEHARHWSLAKIRPNRTHELRVVQTKAILFLKSMSERVGSDKK